MQNHKNSYYLSAEDVDNFMDASALNSGEGILLFGIADPSIKKFLPPPLELTDPVNPMFCLYISNNREPTFSPWYLEGGIGVMARYGDKVGLYYFNLQLSGPFALMGMLTGRESSGLPKKLCDQIVVERTDTYAHGYIERGGVRLVEVEMEIGSYNNPELLLGMEGASETPGGITQDGSCLLFKFQWDSNGYKDLELIDYDSFTTYYSWEPASATVTLKSSFDDPYGEMPLLSVLGAGWYKSDNGIKNVTTVCKIPDSQAEETVRYLLAGRFDRSTMCKGSQSYSG